MRDDGRCGGCWIDVGNEVVGRNDLEIEGVR